jgi:hypothetical protein
LKQALTAMRETADQSGNAAALALAQRLSQDPRAYAERLSDLEVLLPFEKDEAS